MAIPLGITTLPTYGTCTPPYGACTPQDRKPTALVDQLLGRKLRPTPRHLTRAVYLPCHGDDTVHLPVYNVTETYEAAVGDAHVGGCEFKTRLGLMRKPGTRDNLDVDVGFLVNVTGQGSGVTVRERCMGGEQEAYMSLPQDPEDDISIATSDGDNTYSLSTSYPLPPKAVKNSLVEYPYFSLGSADEKHTGSSSLEWQIHPVEQGGLCYTLLDTRLLSRTDSNSRPDAAVRAIYHHAGMEQDLPRRYSEGILLLPDMGEDAAVVVASLIGLLRRVRGRKQVRLAKKSRLGKLRRVLSRRSMRGQWAEVV